MSPHMHQAQLEQLLQGHPLARDVCVARLCTDCFDPCMPLLLWTRVCVCVCLLPQGPLPLTTRRLWAPPLPLAPRALPTAWPRLLAPRLLPTRWQRQPRSQVGVRASAIRG